MIRETIKFIAMNTIFLKCSHRKTSQSSSSSLFPSLTLSSSSSLPALLIAAASASQPSDTAADDSGLFLALSSSHLTVPLPVASQVAQLPSTYLYDATSGLYYDTSTGLYYDQKTQVC